MIILLNRERVLYELVELARLKIVGILQVPNEAVVANIGLEGGKLSPEFSVDADEAKGVSADQIKEVMASVYTNLKAEMKSRLEGLEEKRG